CLPESLLTVCSSSSPGFQQIQNKKSQFNCAKNDLGRIGNDRLVILRQKGFDEPGPHQQQSETDTERDDVSRNFPQSSRQTNPIPPANESEPETKARLTGDQDRRYLDHPMGHQPTEQEFPLPIGDVIGRNGA